MPRRNPTQCPECLSSTRVVETRDRFRRIRECPEGHRFETVEVFSRLIEPRRRTNPGRTFKT